MRVVRLLAVPCAVGVALTACSGGGGTSISIGGQKLNGTDTVVTTAADALASFGAETGANVDNAECHLRVTTFGAREGDSEKLPQSVDCLPVGLLGSSGSNAVSFEVTVEPDPERPKDLVAVVDTDNPILTKFNAGTDLFQPPLPESLPEAGEASVPDGYVLIDDQLVKSSDLEAAASQAVKAMQLDSSHDASVKFTLADDPACLFEASLDSLWCGPGVSLVQPDGEVYNTSMVVSRLNTKTYQVSGDQTGTSIGSSGYWSPVGSEPGSLIDADGKPATLPSVDTIDAPEIPVIEAGYFAEVEPNSGVWLGDCVSTGKAADLCDTEIDQHLEANPTTLLFTSGNLTITRLAFGEQTGSDDLSSIVDAERAADGERLVGLEVKLERDDDVADTTPLNAQILVDGEVKGDFSNASGTRAFFMSAPPDSTISIVLQSDGEDQSLDLKGDTIERTTERPELYEEPDTYTFSGDQTWPWEERDRPVRITDASGWSDEIESTSWIVRDKKAVLPPKGSRFISLMVDLDVYNDLGADTNACSVSLLLADGTVVEPTDTGKGACQTGTEYDIVAIASFAVAPGADIEAVQVHAFTVSKYNIPDITIPAIN